MDGPNSGNTVEGNFLGTNVLGTALYVPMGLVDNVGIGTGQSDVTVGGTTPAARNLMSSCQAGVNAVGVVNNVVIHGNLIGLQASGTALLSGCEGITRYAIYFNTTGGSSTIGGPGPGARNVIAGVDAGISLRGGLHVVQGNLVGTDITGTVKLGLGGYGLDLYQTSNGAIVGGTGAGEANVFAGADFYYGIGVGGTNHVIQGNFIGTDPTGTLNLGNGRVGIQVAASTNSNTLIGGTGLGEANIIAYNGGAQTRSGGIGMSNGSRVTMRGNLIYDNLPPPGGGPGGLAIDLNNDPAGVTRNDFGDGDTGDNNLQNFPNIASAMPEAFANGGAGGTRVIGTLNSTASTTFDLDFYSDDCARFPQEFIQAEVYLGSFQVTTNASGIATFNFLLPVQVAPGALVTATATDPLGNTSEMSQRIVLSSGPPYGDPAGGQTLFIQGMQFEPGVTATVGGVAANVITSTATSMQVTAPALPPGQAHGITAINPSGVSGTLPNGWITRFTDTPQAHFASDFVARLVKNGLTAGCGGGNFCVDSPVTREQMAVFLLRGKEGLCYVPPNCTVPSFPDVPCSSIYSRWINELVVRQVTAGCGGGNYCPGLAVTRDSMAVFLLVMLEGFGYQPPDCVTPTFGDVPCSNPFAKWIYELVERNITAGCGGGNYCPTDVVTRGSMAVFLNVTFSLPQ
jgi:hypothetical protein